MTVILFLPVLFTFFPSNLDEIWYVILSSSKLAAVKTTLYIGPLMNFYLYFPHLLSSLGETWCKRPEHDSAGSFECRDSWHREETLFFIDVDVIKFFCVLRNCDILDVIILVGEFQGYYLLEMHKCSLLNGTKI